MKTTTLILACAFLFNSSYAQQNDLAQLTSEFDKLLSAQFKPNETGATVLVSRKGQVIYKKAFGMANLELDVPMKVDNVFRIGSITKQFTAVAILQLAEKGKLNLQDEITKYVPDYAVAGNKISIEHLLTHTSGIDNKTDMPDYMGRVDLTPEEMIGHFKNLPLKSAPGVNYSYSNMGYFLLGYIIEKASGKTYAQYLEENFFKPLGMTNSLYADDIRIVKNRAAGYSANDNGVVNAQPLSMTHPYAAGSIQSTVEDLFKWQQAVNSNQLIKKESLDKALSKYKLTSGKESPYGYGWRIGNVYESPSTWHGGLINGYMTMAHYLPKEDVFVTVFTNCECNSPEVITAKLAALAIGIPSEYKAVPVTNTVLQGYTGLYENQKGQQRILTVTDGNLYSQIGRGPKAVIRSFQKDMFFFADNPMLTIVFARDQKGGISSLTSRNLGGHDVWTKTNKPIPNPDGIKLDQKILDLYVGEYEVSPDFSFVIAREQGSLFLQATGQEKIELFAETTNTFFVKVNDAQLEFVKDASGKVTKAVLQQGGRKTDARKVR